MRFSIIVAIILLTGLGNYIPNPVPVSKHKFIVVAHRGDHVVYPENTLEAYQEAIKNEADYVEIDLRTTKDGELVSMHDATVNRTSNGTGAVKNMTLAELLQLKVKSKDITTTQIFRVPTFKQILSFALASDIHYGQPGTGYEEHTANLIKWLKGF